MAGRRVAGEAGAIVRSEPLFPGTMFISPADEAEIQWLMEIIPNETLTKEKQCRLIAGMRFMKFCEHLSNDFVFH